MFLFEENELETKSDLDGDCLWCGGCAGCDGCNGCKGLSRE